MTIARGFRCLLALGVAGFVGCNLLPVNLGGSDKADKSGNVAGKDHQPLAPTKYQVRVSQFVFLSDSDLKKDQPGLFAELSRLRDQVYRDLSLPESRSLIQVYVFEDRDHYEQYMRAKYPELPKRRAFFVAQPQRGGTEDLLVYTFRGDRIREDLRHELTHALLHSVLKGVPLWLDEGLAEYFEVPPECDGVNYTHLDQIHHGNHGLFKSDLARLEAMSQVTQMNPSEYREAWAWVHLMLRGRPAAKAVLVKYLQRLRTTDNPGPLQPALAAVYVDPDDALMSHLTYVDHGQRPQSTTAH